MKTIHLHFTGRYGRVLLRLAIAAVAMLCTVAAAQSLGDVKRPSEPLVLKEQGSFFVGGRQIFSDAAGWDLIGLLGQFGTGDVTAGARDCTRRPAVGREARSA